VGVGKERTLFCPARRCGGHYDQDIESHDIVVLMKIGARLPWVLLCSVTWASPNTARLPVASLGRRNAGR